MDISAVILAGGYATRLAGECQTTPKPMLEFGGIPFLAYQVSWLIRSGCKEVIIVSGHLSEVIENFFGTNEWKGRGVRVVCDKPPRGTALTALAGIAAASYGDIFQCNGDTVAEFDFRAAVSSFSAQAQSSMTLLTLQEGVQNQGAALVQHGVVVEFAEGLPAKDVGVLPDGFRGSSTGCYFIRRPLALATYPERTSFEREVLPLLVAQRQLAGIQFGSGRLIDFGTPERLAALRAQLHILLDVYGQPLS